MKKLLEIIDIFEVKVTSILLFVISALFGYLKPLLLYFFIAFIHEFSHLLACIILGLKVNKFIIIPFGATLEVDNVNNINSYKQIIVYLAGPASYFINLIWLNCFMKLGIINQINYDYLSNANTIMCILNLLPIYPLDGFVIVKAVLQLFVSFKSVLKVSLIISIICFVGFVIYNIYDFQPMVLFFLFTEQIKNILNYKKNYKNFLIYKTINKKERKYKFINDYDMFKDVNNYKIENKTVLQDADIAHIELPKYIN